MKSGVFAAGPLPEPLLSAPSSWACRSARISGSNRFARIWPGRPELLLVPNGSPYELDKDDRRQRLARSRVTMTGLPMAYLNRVGGQDELVFDGSSFVMHADGELVVQMADWEEQLLLTEWQRTADGWRCTTRAAHALDPFPADIYQAMVVGLRDYVANNGFPGVLLGLSGGIDSALSARSPSMRLGGQSVGVMMPLQIYRARTASRTPRENARLLGCRHDVVPIRPSRCGAR